MADALTQDQRAGQLTTPLGDDVLVLGRLTADEGLSELFEIRVEALSAEANLDFAGALGLGSTIKYTTNDNLERYFNGVMTEAHWAGASDDCLSLSVRPASLALAADPNLDSRIFAAMTALDIVKQVFNDRGFSAFLDRTTVTPPTLEYCVQYRETDFNFVCRLMEEYGIYYYFVHSDGQHMLVFADAETSHDPISELDALDFIPTDDGGRREAQFLASWSLGRRAQSGKYSLNDYDYNKPSANLLASSREAWRLRQRLDGNLRLSRRLQCAGRRRDAREGESGGGAVAGQAALCQRRSAFPVSRRARYARQTSLRRREPEISRHPLLAFRRRPNLPIRRGRRRRGLFRTLRTHAERQAVPGADRDPQARGGGRAVGAGRGRLGRGDRRRRSRPCACPVLLGPQEGNETLSPGSGRPVLGRR